MLRHLPFHEAGSLIVTASQENAGVIIQTYITNTKNMYIRRKFSGAWNAWRAYASTRVDQTAGRAIYVYDELNQREQLVYGDTGWRNIASSVLNGDATSTLHIRRTLNQVHVKASTNPTNSGGDFFNWPVGFAPDGSTYQPVRYSGAIELVNLYVDTVKIALSQYVSGKGGVFFTGSYFCSQTWPTTLPGTAVGSIPNA
jgi:hypothetical protein